MKKDIEWLREEVYALYPNSYSAYALNDMVLKTEMVDKIIELINQLDEPEVTEEQVWEKIAEYYPGSPIGMKNSFEHFYYGGHLEKEPQKPVIPQFVADYIEKWKHEGLTIYEWFAFNINDADQDVNEWLYDNTTGENTRREYLLFDAIRFGYKVEKEPVYFAKIKGHELVETETILDDDTGDDISEFCRNVYFVLQKDGQIIVDMKDSGLSGAKHVMTMSQWNNLGINETNADFEEVMV